LLEIKKRKTDAIKDSTITFLIVFIICIW